MLKKLLASLLAATMLFSIATAGSARNFEIDENTTFSIVAMPAQPVTTQQVSRPVQTVTNTSKINSFANYQSWIKQLKATNSDVTGWLTVPNTNINVPIVQAGEDKASSIMERNNYYNTRDWKGVDYGNRGVSNYAMTSTYLDTRVVMGETWRSSSRNTVIYGHNWTNLRNYNIGAAYTNHVMFAQLPSYTDINFATQNPYIYYSTENMEGIWKVFAVATVEVSDSFLYNSPNVTEDYLKFLITEWKDRSIFDFSTQVDEKDRILTLSTCTREYSNGGGNQRFVVVARLLRPEETENDVVTATVNTDKKVPIF